MTARRPTAERMLVVVAFALIVVFLLVDGAGFYRSSDGELANLQTRLQEVAESHDDVPVDEALKAKTPLAAGLTLVTAPTRLDYSPATVFTDLEIAAFESERERRAKIRGEIAPPLELRAQRRGDDVEVRFDQNPANSAIAALDPASLLTAGYQLYRWRDRDAPTLVANLPISATQYRDRGLGPRAGTVHYSIRTVLKDRIGDVETLIQSSEPASVSLELEELFTLELLAATTEVATFRITVPVEDEQRSAQFEVDKNAPVGSILRLSESDLDFRTGLVLKGIEIVETTSERPRRIPVFNADGSRARGESGFLVRDEIRKVPVRRITVMLEPEASAASAARTLTRDEDLPKR